MTARDLCPTSSLSSFSTVLVTGGTGSLGQALIRWFLQTYPSLQLRILSRGEHRQQSMREALGNPQAVRFLLGDVRDCARLRTAFRGVDLVIHAAALKGIPACEYDPYEVVETNIHGTMNVVRAAVETQVRQVVVVSSDKAVAPQTCYGASKMMAERLAIQANHYAPHGTRISVIRYGNVAGSQGSIVPLWRKHLIQGRPLPLTHPAMTRFWMTIEEAVQCVWFVARQQSRGGLFVPHLPAFEVSDLARAMLRYQAGVELVEGRDVETIGIRAAEKLHEDLATDQELTRAYWFAPQEQIPVFYNIPPVVRHWEELPQGESWHAPPVPGVGGVTTPIGPYQSGEWPWRFTVGDLQARLSMVSEEYA